MTQYTCLCSFLSNHQQDWQISSICDQMISHIDVIICIQMVECAVTALLKQFPHPS
jgi:hypothetical protein